jgi:hypothetical protein
MYALAYPRIRKEAASGLNGCDSESREEIPTGKLSRWHHRRHLAQAGTGIKFILGLYSGSIISLSEFAIDLIAQAERSRAFFWPLACFRPLACFIHLLIQRSGLRVMSRGASRLHQTRFLLRNVTSRWPVKFNGAPAAKPPAWATIWA